MVTTSCAAICSPTATASVDQRLHWAPSLRLADESVDPVDDRYQELLVGELLAADVVLVGAPMYNWSVPSTLKAWIDWIHVPGLTAPAAPDDPAPLATNRS